MKTSKRSRLSEQEATFVGAKISVSPVTEHGEMILKIVQGLGAGKDYTFALGQNIQIGRQEEAHICLNHSLVSRNHSQIEWRTMEPWIVDLKSTNGTFVNDEKIRERKLQHTDKIKVGNSLMKVELHRGEEGEKTRLGRLIHTAEELLKRVEHEKDQWGRIFSGSIEKVQLPEVLQSVALGKSEGILVVRGLELGKIYIQKGSIFFAKVGKVTGMKALFRMLSWDKGHFDLRGLEDELVEMIPEAHLKKVGREFPNDMTQTLLEFFKSQDEFAILKEKLPPFTATFQADPHKPFAKKSQYERVYQIYEKAVQGRSVQEILDEFPLLDTEIYRVLVFLLERGYLQPA